MAGRRPRLRELKAVLGVAGFLLLAAGQPGQQQQQPEQPVPYSHKTHLAMGLKCDSCHRNADPGEFMGFPAESFCMSCHQVIKADSLHIAKLAAAAQAKKPIRDVMTKEVVHNMKSCMACHAAAKARNDCMACHEEH